MRTPSRGWWSVISLLLAGEAVTAAWPTGAPAGSRRRSTSSRTSSTRSPCLARIRCPSELVLVREHLAIGTAPAVLGLATFTRRAGTVARG